MSSPLHMSLYADFKERSGYSKSAAGPQAPDSMAYYAKILLSLSQGVVHPTNVTHKFLGEHIDPLLLVDTSPSSSGIAAHSEAQSRGEISKRPSRFMVKAPKPKITLTELASKMESSYRGFARQAVAISDTLRELDNNRVHKRERTETSTNTGYQRSSKRLAKAHSTRTPRSRKPKPKSNDEVTKKGSAPISNASIQPSKQRLRLCRANQIKYCGLMPDDRDSKENLVYGSLLGGSGERQSDLVEKKSS
ncbi:uncharacterized protein MELLADRAFT_60935 [Melampsora larici-populina 98AG31]|uniref:Uncharacterized protein n=1 Tax=Melampsora larici-populina (strain 98AG31 / pathotype 3-4-7) TaxID=747676 RepID=F4RCZ8_MELLP|nr:uncharacterized protein MELLADRAFT_60935 [Melampsora larici-populina 98AG31]EGG09900.1 hypothetical protein MELLADRAFT_60935 [Melampsora larici-populina 98AG31]